MGKRTNNSYIRFAINNDLLDLVNQEAKKSFTSHTKLLSDITKEALMLRYAKYVGVGVEEVREMDADLKEMEE